MKFCDHNATPKFARHKMLPLILAVIAIALLSPLRSEAYAGPGAGFAVLSSFWTLFRRVSVLRLCLPYLAIPASVPFNAAP